MRCLLYLGIVLLGAFLGGLSGCAAIEGPTKPIQRIYPVAGYGEGNVEEGLQDGLQEETQQKKTHRKVAGDL